MEDKMALKSDDILNVDIDPTIWLGDELEKLNLESQLDVESLLSLDSDKVNEINNVSKDCENYDLKASVIKDEISTEELAPPDSKIDINGNEETIPDENLNQLFLELELSDSDNEEKDEETSSKLRERGKERRSTKSQNRTNFLGRNERYDRTQFPSRSLQFLSGSTLVQPSESAYQFSSINQSSVLNTSENVSDPLSAPFSIIFEDRRVNSIGSPESGYESSLTGSPPRALLSASVSPNLDLIPETDDDLLFINYVVENEGALTGNDISRCDIDDRDRQGKISELIKYLKDTPYEPESCDSSTLSSVVLASSSNSRDCVPLINNSQDLNTNSLTPQLKNVEKPKLGYKLKDEAKHALRNFLSMEEYYTTLDRIYEEVRKRKDENKDEEGKEDVRVIHVLDALDKTSENRTNLHHAVLNSNLQEIFCLIEVHKQYGAPLSDINIRDKYGKTALDYAIQNGNMTLVVDYLKENTACQSLNI